MISLGLENFRCFKDTGMVEIKPITLLVGENSSGKSSFLRFFPLLKQSCGVAIRDPLAFFGDLVDFGTIDDVISNDSAGHITVKFNIYCESPFISSRRNYDKVEGIASVTAKYGKDVSTKGVSLSQLCIVFNGHHYLLETSGDSKISKLVINGVNIKLNKTNRMSYRFDGPLIPTLYGIDEGLDRNFFLRVGAPLSNDYMTSFSNLARKSLSKDKIYKFINKGAEHDKSELNSYIRDNSWRLGKDFNRKISRIENNGEAMERLHVDIAHYAFYKVLLAVNKTVYNYSQLVKYIGPIRTTAERYYRPKSLSVNEVDYRGQNVAEIIRMLSDRQIRSFREWTNSEFGFEVGFKETGGHLSLFLVENGSESQEINIADKGFGYSQLLPIILQLWLLLTRNRVRRPWANSVILCIEQPEVHLHPRYQALLADVFVNFINEANDKGVSIKLVLETHSKVIVNRIGQIIYEKRMNNDNVAIVLFEKNGTETKVSTSRYDEEGILLNWPHGFFEF